MTTRIDIAHLDSTTSRDGVIKAVIETPRGSRNKFKYDEETGLFTVDRVLPLGAAFPFDFGFIPSTRGEDGDPLDVLVLFEGPTYPGCFLHVRLIGVLEAVQTENGETVRNDRLLAVLDTSNNPAIVQSLEQLRPGELDEIEHFFISYNRWANREFKPLGRHGPECAWELYEQGRFVPGKKHSAPSKNAAS